MKARAQQFPSPIRLALVTTELRPGGAERCLTNLAVGLNRELFSPQVYSLAPPPPVGETQLVEGLQQAAVPVHFVGAQHTTQLFGAVRKLRALLEQQSPDIVQAFLFHANVVSVLATRRMHLPVLAGLRVAQPERMRQFVERRLARDLAGFVCVSMDVAAYATTIGGVPQEKLHVIPNGVDVHAIANVAPIGWLTFRIEPPRRVILFVGRLDPQKGVDILLDASEQFLPQLAEHNLVLIGDGVERAKLQTRIEHRPSRSRIHFAGWRADAARCIAAAEIVVLPSRYEGMSNVLLEAMAAGKPVVATKVEGVTEVLGPLAAQQTCPPNDSAALASAIEKLANDPAAQQQLGEANRARVAEHFSLSKMIDSYTDLYLRTVDRHRSKPSPQHHVF